MVSSVIAAGMDLSNDPIALDFFGNRTINKSSKETVIAEFYHVMEVN